MVWTTASGMLGRLDFQVLPAVDGVEAVEPFRKNRDAISWVLCDVTMPRMSGWETLAALQTTDPGVHVVLTSGSDEAHAMSREQAVERPNAFLSKPWRPREYSVAACMDMG